MLPQPKAPKPDDLLRPRLDEQLNMNHALVRLAALTDWDRIERSFAAHFTSCQGRLALSPRLVAGLL